MRQILIKKEYHLRPDPERPGQALQFLLQEARTLDEGLNLIRLPAVQVLSGGAARFRYTLPRHLAARGVFLLGAYEQPGEVIAYVMSMVGNVQIGLGDACLSVESYCPDSLMPVIIGDQAQFQNGVLVLAPDAAPTTKKAKKKRGRGRS